MPRLKTVQNSFSSGELDPLLIGRTDIKQYFQGAELARNVTLLPQGGATRRDGLEHIGTLFEKIAHVDSPTISMPNGGTGANINDRDNSTTTATTVAIGTTNNYVVAHYDLGVAKSIRFADVINFSLSPAAANEEFTIQYSNDDATWFSMQPTSIKTYATAGTWDKRFYLITPITARYWRFVRVYVAPTDLGSSVASLAEFNLWEDTGVLSEARCVGFEFSITQTYKMVFSDQNIAVYLGKNNIANIPAPFTSDELADITWTQSFDTMLIFHPSHPITEVKRLNSDTEWNLDEFTIDDTPYYRFDPVNTNPATTLTPAATTGVFNVTAGSSVFTTAHVNQYISGNGGYCRIIKYISGTVVKVTAITDFWDTTAIASGSWTLETGYEAAWSSTRGYPNCGTFHQQRLVIGGSRDLPQTMWFSAIGFYGSFYEGTGQDSDGFYVTLDTDSVSAIYALYSGRQLQIFTSNAEYYVPNNYNVSAITPSNIEIRRTTGFGTIQGAQVQNIDGATVFINRSQSAVREFIYADVEQDYSSQNLSILASHLIRTPVDMVSRKSTGTDVSNYVMVLNSDGTIAVLNTLREQGVYGWTLLETNGAVKSIGVELDTIFCVVDRTINGSAVRMVEYFDSLHSTDGSTLVTTGLPASGVNFLGHLEGETVKVIVDGNVFPDEVVSGGSISFDGVANESIEVGLAYVQTGDSSGDGWKMKTMPIDAQLPDGTIVGKKKRLVEVTLQLQNTKALKVNGNRVFFRSLGGELLDKSIQPYNGYKVIEGLLGYGDKAQVDMGDDVPLPATINAIAYKVAV